MGKTILFSATVALGLAGAASAAFAYMAAQPVPVPVAFSGPMSPYAACAAEAQDQWLSGAAYDAYARRCAETAIRNICEDAASTRRLAGKRRAEYARQCAAAIEATEK
jgi:hypothetical protein